MFVTPAELLILERPSGLAVELTQPLAGHADVLPLDPRAATRVSTTADAGVVVVGSRRLRGQLGLPEGDHHTWAATPQGWRVDAASKQATLTIDGARTRQALVGDGARVVVVPGLVLGLRLRPDLVPLHAQLVEAGWTDDGSPASLAMARAAVVDRLGGEEPDVALAVRHLGLRRHLWGTAPLPPLHAAVARGDLRDVAALLAAGHDPNGLGEDLRPPLWGVLQLTTPSAWHPDAAAIVGALRAAGADVRCGGVGAMLVEAHRRGVSCAAEAAEARELEALLACDDGA